MLELICVLAGIVLLFLLFAQARPDDGIRAAVLAAAAWFALYAVVSVLLFAADIFTIRLAAGITDIGLAGAFTAWSWTKKEALFPDLLSFSEICPLLPDSGGCYAVCSRKIRILRHGAGRRSIPDARNSADVRREQSSAGLP